jgi:hypothetical protein
MAAPKKPVVTESLEEAVEQASLAGYSLPESLLRPIEEYTDQSEQTFVLEDEWYGELEAAEPFEEAAKPYKEANPGQHFRYLGRTAVSKRGKRGYQPVVNPNTGKVVEVSGMVLARIPKHVKEQRERQREIENAADARARKENAMEDLNRAVHDSQGGIEITNQVDTALTARDGLTFSR